MTPKLSICVPTLDRPAWLERALRSVTDQYRGDDVEIVVSDSSPGDESGDVVHACLESWAGQWTYLHNDTVIPLVANFNQAVEHSSGTHVLMLSDDDFVVPGGIRAALDTFETYPDRAAYLFGVRIVDEHGRTIRRRIPRRARYLPAAEATRRVLSHSSYVRLPAIAVRRDAMEEAGLFSPQAKGTCDVNMWFDVFHRHGVQLVPSLLSAYTVHQQAYTMSMFDPKMVDLLIDFFERVGRSGAIDDDTLRRCMARFFHQYVLAGTYRNLRWHGLEEARSAFGLFDYAPLRPLPTPLKWWPLRAAFSLLLGSPKLRDPEARERAA